MRAAIYARYSAGPNQTDQSIDGQVRECTKYCQGKGLEVVEVYADRHITGKTDARPEFQRCIADAKKGRFDALVVYKTDRLSRDKYDAVVYKRELKKAGVKLHYAAEAIPDGPEGIILESLMEGLAEYYSVELAQKIKRGMHESALKCKVLGNNVPLGYKAGPKKQFEIDEDAAEAVRMIFQMYLEGKPNIEICNFLNKLGYKTHRNNPFNKNSVNRIISNEKYIGTYRAADVVIENGIPAIIDPATFYRAQKEMARRRVDKSGRAGSAEYLLAGKLFCGHCLSRMSGVSGTGKSGAKHYYYYCPSARHKKGCKKKHVQKAHIESLVVDLTKDYILQAERLKSLSGCLFELQNKADDRQSVIAELKKKMQENRQAANNLMTALEKGLASDSILIRLDGLEKEQAELQSEIAYQETKSFGLTEEQIYFFLRQFLMDEGEDPEAYRKRIIKAFVSEVYIYDDKIDIYYNIKDGDEDAHKESPIELDGASCSTSGQKRGPDGALVEYVTLYATCKGLMLRYLL